jgi:hypothetical protein
LSVILHIERIRYGNQRPAHSNAGSEVSEEHGPR